MSSFPSSQDAVRGSKHHFPEQPQRRVTEHNYPSLTKSLIDLQPLFSGLQRKFAFQDGNVQSQKEHLHCLVENARSRVSASNPIESVHVKLFKNYSRWCAFLLINRNDTLHNLDQQAIDAGMLRQTALFLLIWGEAGNLRFMPECLCYIYHSLCPSLTTLAIDPSPMFVSFLHQVIVPIYTILSSMRKEENATALTSSKKLGLDHKNITNYDDVNEFFWSKKCLHYSVTTVSEAMGWRELKTFKERRSIWNPFLAFFRIYYFLLVMLHILIAIAYVAYRTNPSSSQGFAFYANFMDSEYSDIRKHALLSIFLTVSLLLTLKAVLEVWIGGARIFLKALYAVSIFVRLVWHTIFCALFWAIFCSPNEKISPSSTYLNSGISVAAVYLFPIISLAAIRMLGGNLHFFDKFPILHSLDGTKQQYVGRMSQMAQSSRKFVVYSLFWMIIFAGKFLFNLQLMIKPLIGPSFEIYQISSANTGFGWLASEHNILFIFAMWSPAILVYIYDTQIWLAILQSLVGAWIGVRLKISHSSRIPEFVRGLNQASYLFDRKIVTEEARRCIVNGGSNLPADESIEHSMDRKNRYSHFEKESSLADTRLRFAVVWNEIMSSFRLSDLLDDRETAILQYQLSDSGAVEDPVFLLAGRAQKAIDIALKCHKYDDSDDDLYKALEKAQVLACARNCIEIGFHVLRMVLGDKDKVVLETLQEIIMNTKVRGVVNLNHLTMFRDNMVKLIAGLLDFPDPILEFSSASHKERSEDSIALSDGRVYRLLHKNVLEIVHHVASLMKCLELMIEQEWMVDKIRNCVFAKATSELTYQKEQLIRLFLIDETDRIGSLNERHSLGTYTPSKDGAVNTASTETNETLITWSTRLFFLLTLDASDSLPRCLEAQRRMSFFLNSLAMNMPHVHSIASMHSFSVITPYYNEPVLYSTEELRGRVSANPLFLKVEHKNRDLSILKYLITFHSDEWGNFLERIGSSSMEEALRDSPTQVRLWASMRGQTLSRTVHGIMLYEDALKMLRWLEVGSNPAYKHGEKLEAVNAIAGTKFTYITSCQLYSQQVAAGDTRAQDIDLLLQKYPSWRVSYVDMLTSQDETRYDCVLVKSDGSEIVEVYRYALPGNPMIGEGKPENQNIALPFTRGEYVQTIDMNQEHYFEEALKMPNFLNTANEDASYKILGMKEHIFTGRASSLAQFMTLQELVFVSLTQRVLANPLECRMHYGHPDVFDKFFIISNGGVAKASKGINLSEDVFSGYNVALRGGRVAHIEFMQCGKGRDVTLSQINAFEAKLANGCAESSLSRDAHRMGHGMDFFRLNSMFYGHMGFYICNALTVFCVFCYAYSKVYIALHQDVQTGAIIKTNELDQLAETMNTQFIFQFGMLMTIPLMATLFVEFGWRQAIIQIVELMITLGPVFYIFETGTKAHFYDVALMRGGSKYRGTGRGFAIVRETLVSFYKEYAASHYRKAVELLGLMILFGIYGKFDIGIGTLDSYCTSMGIPRSSCTVSNKSIPGNITLLHSYGSKGQNYGIASFAVWLLGTCWLFAPFVFNTDGFDFAKSRVDIKNWVEWMMSTAHSGNSAIKTDSWVEFWSYESQQSKDMRWTARVAYAIREFRHPFFAYQIFTAYFGNFKLLYLILIILASALTLWIGHLLIGNRVKTNQYLVVRGVLYFVIVLGGFFVWPIAYGGIKDWSYSKSLALSFSNLIGMYSLLQYIWILNGIMGIRLDCFGFTQQLAFFFDMVVGAFLFVPLFLFSAIPFMRTIQTRMMYNGGFTRALSTGSELAAFLCILVGLLAGFSYGWFSALIYSMGYVNNADDHFVNQSFLYFVNEVLNGDFNMRTLKVYAALASAIATLPGAALGSVLGRRMGICFGVVIHLIGVGILFSDAKSAINVAVYMIAGADAILSFNAVLYNFEICTRGWKGKGVVLFLVGSALGYLVEASILQKINDMTMKKNWANKPLHDWRNQFIFGSIPLVILFVVVRYFPESPVWLYRHRGSLAAQACLIHLRQKHDVSEEIQELQEAFLPSNNSYQVPENQVAQLESSYIPAVHATAKWKRLNIYFRLIFIAILQSAFAILNSSVLLRRVHVKSSKYTSGDLSSKWMIYFGLLSFIGIALSLMSVDTLRRKTILKDILPFTSILSIFCGFSKIASFGNSVIVSIVLFVLFASSALSLACTTWLTAIEIFPLYEHSRYISSSFVVYYIVQALVHHIIPSFALSHFVYAALCGALTIILFTCCASTKDGAIQLKSEKAASLELQSFDDNIPAVTSHARKTSRSQSFLRSRQRKTSVRISKSATTPVDGNYEPLRSPTNKRALSVRADGNARHNVARSSMRVSHVRPPSQVVL